MKKGIGSVLTIIGIIGLIVTGYRYYENSSSTHILGSTVTVTQHASLWPVIIAAIVFIIGIILLSTSRGR